MGTVKALYGRYRALIVMEEKEETDPCADMELSGKTADFTEDREEAIRKFRCWMYESALQLRMNFIDREYDQKRLRRVVDIVNKIKVCLKATAPLGIQTEDSEEDKNFLSVMTTNEELIDLGQKIKCQRDQMKEDEEAAIQEEEGEKSPPRGMTPTPIKAPLPQDTYKAMHPQGMSTPNAQGKRGKKSKKSNGVEEILIQDGEKVRKSPDALTKTLAEVGCYSERENQTLSDDLDEYRKNLAKEEEEKERLEKEEEEMEKEEEERKKKELEIKKAE